ncbi:hypothetical protein BBO99_00000625 [Phytophthora kernoviae]|uniref:RCC1-like domain-containing protein n=1 Tax=Phytophthora kernoviae TaxID=325452 RepID=A0A3R7JC91_9STRA|nr:hypothetical protein JM16_001458 [Phytophthora kernoviae]RLN43796.1 hypothetical protein BBI17_001442 [Phytophthora kernoviae]RLN85379.1 hypothetical protein BBO99_00000625 [Phytophthora kernoviae]
MYALAARPNEPPVFWYTNTAEINVFYWNYREYVRRSGGKPTLIKVENNVLEITRRVLRREHALVSRIQARWRGLTTRMIFREFKQQKGWLKGIQQSPAVKIQRLFRGHESRRFCRALQGTIKYPAQREAYRREMAARKQQAKAVDFRERLLAKYKYQLQIKRTTRMMVHQCILMGLGIGSLYMWGETHWGQLGLPKEYLDSADLLLPGEATGHDKLKAHVLLPIKCPILEEGSGEIILKVSCGGTHTAALTNLGRVYVWGRGDSGQLGIGSTWLQDTDDDGLLGVSRPHLLEGFNGEKVVQVACGAFHSAAVTEEGHVYIWGKEDYGMLGVGQTSDQQTPKRVEFFDTIPALRVSCGGWHTVVVAKSGDCYAFGRGEYGRLGLGDTKSRTRPHLVKALQGKTVIQAACGGSHTLFVTSDGIAYVAGRPDHGRLGLTDIKSLMVPTCLDLGPIPVRQVSAGGAHSVAVMHSSRPIFSPMISPLPTSNPVPHRALV